MAACRRFSHGHNLEVAALEAEQDRREMLEVASFMRALSQDR
jgi:hypothetical protein